MPASPIRRQRNLTDECHVNDPSCRLVDEQAGETVGLSQFSNHWPDGNGDGIASRHLGDLRLRKWDSVVPVEAVVGFIGGHDRSVGNEAE
jgi:hypothetical protein